MFRSTGSYEPDLFTSGIVVGYICFDPQALTSLTYTHISSLFKFDCFDPQALTSLTKYPPTGVPKAKGFDPQALTSLTSIHHAGQRKRRLFRSTGSYEPDLSSPFSCQCFYKGFDPQALTSLTC